MGEKIKIYISASQQDYSLNQNEEKINSFFKLLEIFLSRFYNYELEHTFSFNKEKNLTIDEADVFIIFLSQRYLAENKNDELNIILTKKNKKNIFKILMSDLPKTNQPLQLHPLINYYFYYYDTLENKILDFFELQEKQNILFNTKIINLGYDIIRSIAKTQDSKPKEEDAKKNIYLAYAGDDQATNREIVKRELQNKGYTVLPEKIDFDNKEKLVEQLSDQISKSFLAIHFLGEDNNRIPGITDNLIELQNHLAIEHYKKLNEFSLGQKDLLFSRIIWLPNDLHCKEESQQIWLENFIQSADSQIGAELIETPIETLKTIIDEKITKKESSTTQMLKSTVASTKKIYVVYEYKNESESEKINEVLKKYKQNPIITRYDKNYLSVIENHRQNLIEADSILILYINNNPEWLQSKIMDIRKAPGFGRRKSFKNKIIISAEEIDTIQLNGIEFTQIKYDEDLNKKLEEIFAKSEK